MVRYAPPAPAGFVPAASEAQLARHPGGWVYCKDRAPHAPHQMRYDPWEACPGLVKAPEPPHVPPDEVLPCGCRMHFAIVDGTRTMTFQPCRESCINFRNMLGEADEKHRPVEIRTGA